MKIEKPSLNNASLKYYYKSYRNKTSIREAKIYIFIKINLILYHIHHTVHSVPNPTV